MQKDKAPDTKGKALSVEQKQIWNDAVRATCKEIKKWDGVIPYSGDREHMADTIKNKLSFKIKNPIT